MNYRPDIDGLRALAVLSVLLCHFRFGLPGGYVGVDVFFVISGYLITRIMLKELDAGEFSLAGFWERRVRRILPPLALVVAVSFVAGWFISPPTAYYSFGQSVCELVLLKANRFFSHDVGYFAAAETKPLLHTWSLAVEEQFYVLIPFVFWLAARFARRGALLPLLVVVAGASFVVATIGSVDANPRTYFQLLARAWELLAGVALALRTHARPPLTVRRIELWSTAALAAIVIPCLCYNHLTPFPGPAALPPVVGAVLLIALGADAQRRSWVHRLLSSKPLVSIGLISYSLYLWHWPILVYYKSLYVEPPSVVERTIMLLASLGLAELTRRLVEAPFRSRKLLATRTSVFAATAMVLVAIHSGGRLIRKTDGFASRLPPQVRAYAATGKLDDRFMKHLKPGKKPNGLMHLGADDAEPVVLFWGDSHAGAIVPAIERVCRAQRIGARAAIYPGWSPVVEHMRGDSRVDFAAAQAFSDEVKQFLRDTPQVRTVVFAAYWRRYHEHPQFTAALLRTVDELRAMDRDVYFMKDVPEYDYDVVARLTQCAWRGRDASPVHMSVAEYDSRNDFYPTLLPLLVEHGAKILDPLPGWHAATKSSELLPGDAEGMYYSDGAHLSAHGSRLIDPMLEPLAATLVAERAGRTTTVQGATAPVRR